MKSKNFSLIIALAMLLITIIVIIPLPDVVPTHFDIHGVADAWGSKWSLLMTPGIMLGMWVFWIFVDRSYDKLISADDEKAAAEAMANRKVFNITSVVCTFLFVAVGFFSLYSSVSQIDGNTVHSLDIMRWITVVMGASFIFLGNVMPKAKNNPNVGFRLPWTRYNDVTWYKCNRVGGISMVITGIVTILGGIIFGDIVPMIIMMSSVTLSIVVISVYSYVVYRNERENGK